LNLVDTRETTPPVRKWKAYSTYKDSGIESLGEIPTHWEISLLRRKLKNGSDGIKIGPFGSQLRLEYMQDSGFKVYGQEHVIANDFTLGLKYVGENKFRELAACVVQPGDLLITMMGTSGRCQLVPSGIEPGIMDSHLLRLRVRDHDINPHFAALVLDTAKYVEDHFQTMGKGAIMHGLNSSLVKSIVLAIPPPCEQQMILAFLDRETAKIDALVAKKERLTELLQEKRAALITCAVTKGLDPNAPMKDSGVEWLGEIPAHWEVQQLKHIARLRSGEAITSFEIEESGDYPVYGGNGQRGYTSGFTHEGEFPLIGRQGALCGCINYASGRFWASEHAVVVTPIGEHVPTWLGELLRSMDLAQYSQSAAQPGLAVETIAALLVPVLSMAEERAIAAFLEQETAKIDALIVKIREGIEKLKEYRTALISAAVTGKIDVRAEISTESRETIAEGGRGCTD